MGINFSSEFDDSGLVALTSFLDVLPEQIQKGLQRAVKDGQQILTEASNYPDKVKYPIQWTSEKQRKAFFATDGFGSGIPYQRTGGLGRAWQLSVTNTLNGGILVLENTSPVAKYVYGTFVAGKPPQQGFHINTGWQSLTEKQKRYLNLMIGYAINAIQDELEEL